MGYDAESLLDAIRVLGVEFAHRRAELTQLDQEIGDGDHGENLARGFSAVLTKLHASQPETPAKVLSLVALDDELVELWDAPVRTPALTW